MSKHATITWTPDGLCGVAFVADSGPHGENHYMQVEPCPDCDGDGMTTWNDGHGTNVPMKCRCKKGWVLK